MYNERGITISGGVILALCCSIAIAGSSGKSLIGLPPTQGTSGSGAFEPGIYQLDYTNQQIYDMRYEGIEGIRICINVETANDQASLDKIAGYFDNTTHGGIICMFDTRKDGEGSHGNGKINDLDEMAAAWANIHNTFSSYSNVEYELFNEPFGYGSVSEYMYDMNYVITNAGLPESRCILDGMGYATDVQAIKDQWSGALAYHIYNWWLSGGQRSQTQYSNLMQIALDGVSNRTYISEFGSDLNGGDVYDTCTWDTDDWGARVNVLRGIHDAVNSLDGLAGMANWHGWNNGDSYDFWDSGNYYGREKIKSIHADDIQGECGGGPVSGDNFFTQAYSGTRNNYTGWVGYEFEPTRDISIDGLGRAVSGSMNYPHDVKIWRSSDQVVVAAVTIDTSDSVDSFDYAYEGLENRVTLTSGTRYRIASTEMNGGDPWRDYSDISGHTAVAAIIEAVYGSGEYPSSSMSGSTEQGYVPATFFYIAGDLTGDGVVDLEDLKILTDYWLTAEPQADIAPAGGDGIVDMLDFAALAAEWSG